MKDFNNPLFESLVFKANRYGMLDEQESSGKAPSGAVYQDFAVSLTTIGAKLVENYIKAVAGYPETDFKKKYMTELPSKIGEIAKAVNPQDNINAQITALLTAVTKELNDFLGQSKNDGVYGKHLVKWRNALRDAFSNYKLGIEDAKTYMAKYTGTFDPKVTAMLSNSLASIKTGVEKAAKEREEFTANRESLNISRYTKTGESATGSMGIIEKLVDKKIVIDFRSFSTVVNEEKLTKRQAKKEANGLLADIDSTIGSINGVLTQLAARESDPRRKDFKSIQMKPAFAQIGGDINDIRTQITDDAGNLKPRRDLAELPLDQLGSDFDKAQTLFTDKQKEYEDLYSKEEGGMKSTKTLDVATPEVNKRISDGDQVFGTLSSLSLYAGQMAAEEMAKPPAAAAGTAGTAGSAGAASTGDFKIKEPIKKGSKDKENIKKFQQLVIDKMKSLKGKAGWYDSLEASAKQFGNFGSKTDSAIKGIKGGLKIKDGNSDITQELIDKVSSWDGKIEESYSLHEQFDLKASNAAAGVSSSGSSSKGGSKGSGEGSPKKTSAFKCIKDLESGLTISGGTATLKRDGGSTHEFKSNGTYRFYYAGTKKWMEGTWKCVEGGFEAYTKEDSDTYYGKAGVNNWKTNLDSDKAAAAAEASKAAAAIRTKGEEAAKALLNALAGATEDEKAVYKIFKEQITSKEIFEATETAWASIWPSDADLTFGNGYYAKKTWAEIFKRHHSYTGKKGQGLYTTIQKLFNDAEISRLNGYLPSGVPKF